VESAGYRLLFWNLLKKNSEKRSFHPLARGIESVLITESAENWKYLFSFPRLGTIQIIEEMRIKIGEPHPGKIFHFDT